MNALLPKYTVGGLKTSVNRSSDDDSNIFSFRFAFQTDRNLNQDYSHLYVNRWCTNPTPSPTSTPDPRACLLHRCQPYLPLIDSKSNLGSFIKDKTLRLPTDNNRLRSYWIVPVLPSIFNIEEDFCTFRCKDIGYLYDRSMFPRVIFYY